MKSYVFLLGSKKQGHPKTKKGQNKNSDNGINQQHPRNRLATNRINTSSHTYIKDDLYIILSYILGPKLCPK